MKITRIEIKDFQQFKDFTLDLTYPAGHPKAGEPLDKVCFIGQSGTGKTTILNVLRDFFSREYEEKYNNISKKNRIFILNYQFERQNITNYCYLKDEILVFRQSLKSQKKLSGAIYLQTGLENYASTLLGRLEDNYPIIRTAKDDLELKAKYRSIRLSYIMKSCIEAQRDFSDEKFRIYLLNRLDDFDKMLTEKSLKNDWQSQSYEEFIAQNPRIQIAQKLKPILDKFQVEISTDVLKGKDGIKLQTANGMDFELPFASTGTKQIMLSALPLLLMDTTNKVILFDEPERSLFPDIQKELINFYTHIAPESQFFFATHSPLIASQFEPWEIVELKFDERTGKVYQEDYLKKGMERHVDNYRFYPKYMRWDSILTEIYDLEADGNEEREKALQELAQADEDIKYHKAQGNTQKVAELVKIYKALAEKLLWNTHESN